jgi:cytochrome P450
MQAKCTVVLLIGADYKLCEIQNLQADVHNHVFCTDVCTNCAMKVMFSFCIAAVPEWFPTIDNLQYKAAVTRLDNVVYRLIAERRSQLASSSAPAHQDLLTRLLQVKLCYLFDLRTLYMIMCIAKEKF